jgi:N-formylglutamate deformylase
MYTQSEIEKTFGLNRGSAPLLVSVPHSGTLIPDQLVSQMTEAASGSIDSDWFMRELYEPIVSQLGGSLVYPIYSRYVIDLNRPDNDQSLYPGMTTTGLCPTERFDGVPLYEAGQRPSSDEKSRRLDLYWRAYHHALKSELARLVEQHGYVLLWEGHSIRSVVPRLFDGRLCDLNIGTNQGRSCDALIEQSISTFLPSVSAEYTSIVNGRFKGGYITRFYGQPLRGIHAVQLELSQSTYLQNENKPSWDAQYAQAISMVIKQLIEVSLDTLNKAG